MDTDGKFLTGYPSKDRPWLKYYSNDAITAAVPNCSVYHYLLESNKDFPEDIALLYFNERVTYGELFDKIDQAASAFLGLGVKPDEIVTIALPTLPEALYTFYALNKIGAVANFIHPMAGKQEILNYLNEVESRVCVLFHDTYELVKKSLSQTFVKTVVVVSPADSLSEGLRIGYEIKNRQIEPTPFPGRKLTYRQFLKQGIGITAEAVEKDPDKMTVISHTGGTTGEPKGCMISDRNINSIIFQVGITMAHNRQERCLVVLPPFVNYNLVNGMLEPLTLGISLVLIPKYDPLKFNEYVKNYRPGHINSIPAYYEAILNIPEMKELDLSCLMNCYYGGEGMSEEIERKVNELFLAGGAQNILGKGLGATEFTSSCTATFPHCNAYGSVGIPFVKNLCKIVDPDSGEELTYNKVGELCFTGPSLMLGYYHNTKATDDLIHVHDDGLRWMHSGDLGYMTEDGVIYVSGRIKRIFMTKGPDGAITKIFPDRVESALAKHPAVEISCVIGVNHPLRIHYPKAFVVLKPGFSGDVGLTNEIKEFCKNELPGYMIPDEIDYLMDLPRTSRGKVDHRKLEKTNI